MTPPDFEAVCFDRGGGYVTQFSDALLHVPRRCHVREDVFLLCHRVDEESRDGSVVTEAFLTVSWKSPAPIVTLESPLFGMLEMSEKDQTHALADRFELILLVRSGHLAGIKDGLAKALTSICTEGVGLMGALWTAVGRVG